MPKNSSVILAVSTFIILGFACGEGTSGDKSSTADVGGAQGSGDGGVLDGGGPVDAVAGVTDVGGDAVDPLTDVEHSDVGTTVTDAIAADDTTVSDAVGGDVASGADSQGNLPDGGTTDGGTTDGGGTLTVKVEMKVELGKAVCTVIDSALPADTVVVFAFSKNTGAYADETPTKALKATFSGTLAGCDLIACTATVGAGAAATTSDPASAQIAMGDACGVGGCYACGAKGGCATATAGCDDGDDCTSDDKCGAGGCSGTAVKPATWYYDMDLDGAGGAVFGGNTCGVPAAAAIKAGTFVAKGGDCDDKNPLAYPGAAEICDGIDTDCSGGGDEDVCKSVVPAGTTGFSTDGPMTGDTFSVGATGTLKTDLFGDVTLKGTVTKGGKDAPVTYCLSGPVTLAGALSIEGGTLKVCKDADGKVTATVTGTAVVEKNKGKATCTLDLAPGGTLACVTDTLTILGVSTTGAHVSWAKGDAAVAVSSAKANLDYLGQQVEITLSGDLVADKDTSLTFTVDAPGKVAGLGKLADVVSKTGAGKIARVSAVITTTLSLQNNDLTVGTGNATVGVGTWAVAASRTAADKWTLGLEVGAVSLANAATISLSGAGVEGAEELCAKGSIGATPSGAKDPAMFNVCFKAGVAPIMHLAATVTIAPVGELALVAAWDATAKKICLQGLASAKFLGLGKGAAGVPLSAEACLDVPTMTFDQPTLNAKLSLGPLGSVALSGNLVGDKLCLNGDTTVALGASSLALTASACTNAKLEGLTAIASGNLPMPPFGTKQASAPVAADAKALCFTKDIPTQVKFDATNVKLEATRCITMATDSQGKTTATLTDGPEAKLTVTHAKLGTFSLTGAWDDTKKQLCVSGALPKGSGDVMPIKGATWLGSRGTTCYSDGSFGPMGTNGTLRIGDDGKKSTLWVDVTGGLDGAGGACAVKASDGAACQALNKTWEDGVENPVERRDARFRWVGAACYDLQAANDGACQLSKGFWDTSVTGRHGVSLTPFCKKAGTSTCGYADACDDKGDSACAQLWRPFGELGSPTPTPIVNFALGKVSGLLMVGKAAALLTFDASTSGNAPTLDLISVGGASFLSLEKAGVTAILDTKGEFVARLSGESQLDLGATGFPAWSTRLLVSATVTAKDARFVGEMLPASCANGGKCTFPAYEPYALLLGKGNYKIETKGAQAAFTINWLGGADLLVVEMLTTADISVLDSVKAKSVQYLRVNWPKAGPSGAKPKAALAFIARLKEFGIKAGKFTLKLGETKDANGKLKAMPIAFIAATKKFPKMPVDTDDNLANGTEDVWLIPEGVTIRSMTEIKNLAHLFPVVTAQVDVTIAGKSEYTLRGTIKSKWELIKPDYGVPTLSSAALESFYVDINYKGLAVPPLTTLKIGGTAGIVTLDRKGGKHNLTGVAEFLIDNTGSIGGTLALNGLWQEPFYIPNLALMNAGITLKLKPTVPPVPTAFGFSANGLLHKADFDATWPKITEDAQHNAVGVNANGSPMSKLPKSVSLVGASFYLDTVPQPAAFCGQSTCAPTPPLLVRIDHQNLSTTDMVWAVGQLQKTLASILEKTATMKTFDPVTGKLTSLSNPFGAIGKALPLDKAVNLTIPGDVQFDLNRAMVYFSSHNQLVFGLDWPFGFRLDLDAAMTVPAGPEKGKKKSLYLTGAMDVSGIELNGRLSPLQVISGIDIVADPFRKMASVGGSNDVRLPTQIAASGADSVELAVRGPAMGGDLLTAKSGGKSIRLYETAESYAPCDAKSKIELRTLDGTVVDCSKPARALALELKTDSTSVPAGSRTRVVRTAAGVRFADKWQRLAYTVGSKGQVRLYVDGRSVSVVDSADGADGEPDTKDDKDRFALPTMNAYTHVGQAASYIDELRFWNDVRSGAELSRYLDRLPKGAHNDSSLLAWYEADFDEKFDTSGSGIYLRDSHLPGLHGTYQGSSKPELDTTDQDLRVSLSLPVLDPLLAGMGFDAGLAIALPSPLAALLGTKKLAVAARMKLTKSLVMARLYTRKLRLIPIPGIGGFQMSGNGPNGKADDFDDGLFFDATFAPSTALSDGKMPTIDASATLGLDWKGTVHQLGEINAKFGCLAADGANGAKFTGKECSLGNGYHIYVNTKLGKSGTLSLPLGGNDKLGLTGTFEATTLKAPFRITANAALSAYGRNLAKQSLMVDGKGITGTGALNLGNIYGVDFGAAASLSVNFDWSPARLCGAGKTQVDVLSLAKFDGTVSACFGTNPSASFSGTAKTGTLGATLVPVTDLSVSLSSTAGLLIKSAKLSVPALYSGNLSGYFKNATSFDVNGTSVVQPGSGYLMRLTSTARVYRSGNTGGGTLSAVLDTTNSYGLLKNWASGTIAGGFEVSGSTFYYGLAGDATLKPAGFKLASGRFWACNPKSAASSSLPAECKSAANAGFGARGVIDVGIGKAWIAGTVQLGTKIGTKVVDRLDLNGGLNVYVHKYLYLKTNIAQRLTYPPVSNYYGTYLTGTMSVFGMTSNISATMTAAADGRPNSLYVTGAGTLKPYSGMSLSSGWAKYQWTPKSTTASAGGKITIGSILSTNVSTNISTSGAHAFSGSATVKVASVMYGTTTVTLNSSGAKLYTSMTADTYIADLTGTLNGTIPYNGKFSFGGSGSLKIGPFPTASVGNFSAHYSNGIAGTASVDLKVVKMSVKASAQPTATGLALYGTQTYNWTLGNFNFPYVTEAVKYVANALSGWSCSTYCASKCPWPAGSQCCLYWFKCTKKTTHNDYKGVGAKVTFVMSGTSYKSSHNVALKATATLNVGPVKGSSSTTCGIGSNPSCCFKFPSPIGNQCLKLY